MKTKDQNKSTPILSAFCLVAIIFGWLLIAPQFFGGQSTYIIIIGNSMEPDLEYGDLVLVRDSTDYTIGDIVAYTQPDVGAILHRIISIENGAYTLKGDNNSWEDSYNPCKQEIIGKLWIHIPSAGKYFQKFRTPAIFTSAILF
ncbi:MAG: signal peptidase I, partial [Desulfosporosinus sp.]|nr:signal peptidase I [Desulfosporosinus sp.]